MKRPSLWFVVPAHGRLALTRICLRQLRRTIDDLEDAGVDASAVVIADDENLDTADEFGFGTIRRNNLFLSRRFNDGIQLACDRSLNPRPVDYVVPLGSDDWIAAEVLFDLPRPNTVVGFKTISFVREDGRELTSRFLDYDGGAGIRIYPRAILKRLAYRPADEDRVRGCDTSIWVNLQRTIAFRVEYPTIDTRQIVDWKSTGSNRNAYAEVAGRWRGSAPADPFEALAGVFPAEALEEMATHYGRDREAVVA
jgi:glycosyltransferase involved in cell wall biosynthesis